MHFLSRSLLAILSSLGAASAVVAPAAAARFEEADVPPGRAIAVAAPIGRTNGHQLLILEQLSDTRACWQERGSSPTQVEPLLLDFDFTGICRRSTDSNGYSLRVADRDLGMEYDLRVVQRSNELVLMGIPPVRRGDRSLPNLEIGRTRGLANGFTRIHLDPGWRLSYRTYGGQRLGHFYLTNDRSLAQLANGTVAPAPPPPGIDTLPPVAPTSTIAPATNDAPTAVPDVPTIEFGESPRALPATVPNELPQLDRPAIAPEPDATPVPPPSPREQLRQSPLPALTNDEN